MASVVPLDIEQEEVPLAAEGLMLQDILSGQNLAELLPESELGKIGQQVIRDVEIDEQSRGDWQKRYERSLDVAMQVKKPKTFPWPKAANVKYPLLTVAAIQFQARAYPAIVDGSNLVKGRVLGPDENGEKRARADRIGQHMTWQLLYRMPGWEEETDKLLLMLPITGCVFRKTWYDQIENANRSEIVSGEDFIINYWAKSIETAPRYTQVLHYYPYEVAEFIAAGMWLDVPLDDQPDGSSGDDDQALGDYYEQHRCLDLDQDGYPEHYVVTCTKEGKIARIVPCFGPENIRVQNLMDGSVIEISKLLEAGRIDLAGNIVKIERRQYFTKYGFIPAPDGSFYDIGFGSLLDDITETIDTTLNQMLDAGALQNAQGGFIGSGVNVRGGNFRFTMGEWKRVDIASGMLKDNIYPMNTLGPSAVLYNLLELLIGAAEKITSSSDALQGVSAGTEQPTTLLARIEQAQKVMTGIFKRIYRAFGQELRILRRLNRDFLDEEEYFQLNDSQEAIQIGRQDYADDDLDVVPVADPTQVSDMQKIARSTVVFQTFNGDPLINQKKIRQDFLQGVGATDVPTYFEVPQPQPDPALMVKMGELDIKKQDAASRATTAKASAAKAFMEAARGAAEIFLLEDAATLAAQSVEEGLEEEHEPDGPSGLPGMAGPSADEGIQGLPQGAEAGPDGGMGYGQPDVGLPAGGGLGIGGPGEPQG
jgi:chaperonin GroES